MPDVNIGAKVSVDTGNAGPSVKEVRDSIKQLKQELDSCTVGSEQHRQALERLRQANEQLNPKLKEQTSAFGMLNEHLGKSVPAFGQAAEGAKGFGSTLKALMANPIVLLLAAIVAGLKFLYDAFKSTREGAEQVEQVFDGLKAVAEVLWNRLMSFGGAIIKLFSGDLKGAFNDAKAAVAGIGDEISRVYDRATQISARLQQLKKEQVVDDVDRAKRERDLALIREKLNDETVPIKERLAAARQLREEQIKNSEDDLKRTTEIANLKIEKLKMERDGERKNYEEIAELQKSIFETQKENALEGVRTNKVIKNLQRQQDAEDASAEKDAKQKATEAEKARRDNMRAYLEKLTALQQENELNAIRDGYQKKLKEAEFAQDKEVAQIKESYRQRKITTDQMNTLLAQNQQAYNSKVEQIDAEHQKEEAQKRKDFEKEMLTASGKDNLDGIKDARQKERAALDKALSERTAQVLANEKYTQEQKQQLVAAYESQNRKQQQALTDRYAQEDHKKLQELEQREIKLKIDSSKKKFDLQRQELDLKKKLIDEDYNYQLQQAGDNALKIRELELKHNEDIFQITQARMGISKAEREARISDAEAVSGALTAIGNVIGQQTVLGKGLAIAAALINTYTGITKALAQGGIAGIAGAVAVGATGFASVAKIVSTQVPGQGSGSTAAPSVTAITPAPLQAQAIQSTTTLDAQSVQALGNATARAYVVEKDITDSQERQMRLNRAARIG